MPHTAASQPEARLAACVARAPSGERHRPGGVLHRARLTAALLAPVSAESATWLARIPSTGFGPDDLLHRMRLADRVSAWAHAQASAVLAEYAGPVVGDNRADRRLRLEVRIARRSSADAAGLDIAAARDLAGPCLPVRNLGMRGPVSHRHVAAILDRTALAFEELAGAVADSLASRLPATPASKVRAEVSRLMARIDHRGQPQRARTARTHDVGVRFRSLPDGLGEIVATLKVEDARAVAERLDGATAQPTDLTERTRQRDVVVEADPRWYAVEEPPPWDATAWRDPWVLRDDDGPWQLLVTAGSVDGAVDGAVDDCGVIGHAASDDLRTWTGSRHCRCRAPASATSRSCTSPRSKAGGCCCSPACPSGSAMPRATPSDPAARGRWRSRLRPGPSMCGPRTGSRPRADTRPRAPTRRGSSRAEVTSRCCCRS